MADIYQEIWDADQETNGVKAIRKGDSIDSSIKSSGYVIVDEQIDGDKDHQLLPEVFIPDSKMKTYRLAEKLFNNYTLDQTKPETNTASESEEIQELLEIIVPSKPMKIARDYVSERIGEEISENRWWRMLEQIWFEQFDIGDNRNLSGFEHVMVGEQKEGKLQGYHFWYKYYYDEHLLFNDDDWDLIDVLKLAGKPENTPDSVTLSYIVRMLDYEKSTPTNPVFRKLTKPVGGFWVGTSVEGLMALGAVRFVVEAMAPKRATINGHIYRLEMFRSPDDRKMRTFFPKYDRPE